MGIHHFSPSICPCCREKIFLDPQNESVLCPCCGEKILVASAIQLFQPLVQGNTSSPKQSKKGNKKTAKTDLSDIFPIGLLLLLLIGLFLIMGELGSGGDDSTKDSLGITIGTNSSSFISKDYHDVFDALKDLGFSNITLEPIDDLITGWLTKEYSVKEVSIDGTTSFRNSDRFPADAKIVIRYHTFPNDSEHSTPTPTPTAMPSVAEGQVRIGEKSSAFVDKDYQYVVNQLYSLGFKSVTLVPVDDLITGWITKEFSVESVSINGETSFTADDVFSVDATVIVRYHVFPESEPTPTQAPTATPTPNVSNEEMLSNLSSLLNNPNVSSKEIQEFAEKYKGRTITCDDIMIIEVFQPKQDNYQDLNITFGSAQTKKKIFTCLHCSMSGVKRQTTTGATQIRSLEPFEKCQLTAKIFGYDEVNGTIEILNGGMILVYD